MTRHPIPCLVLRKNYQCAKGGGRGARRGQQCTDKKENKIFLLYKKVQKEQLQSHIWLTASSYVVKYLHISSYIRKAFLIYDFATDHIWISLYMKKISFFFFISVKGKE
jgi:hypothetical protein